VGVKRTTNALGRTRRQADWGKAFRTANWELSLIAVATVSDALPVLEDGQ